jgi:hypothetical protein
MELPARASKANVEDQKESVKPNSANSAKFKGLQRITHEPGHDADHLFSSVPKQDGFGQNMMT